MLSMNDVRVALFIKGSKLPWSWQYFGSPLKKKWTHSFLKHRNSKNTSIQPSIMTSPRRFLYFSMNIGMQAFPKTSSTIIPENNSTYLDVRQVATLSLQITPRWTRHIAIWSKKASSCVTTPKVWVINGLSVRTPVENIRIWFEKQKPKANRVLPEYKWWYSQNGKLNPVCSWNSRVRASTGVSVAPTAPPGTAHFPFLRQSQDQNWKCWFDIAEK